MSDSGSSQAGEYQWRLSSKAKIADQYAHAIGVIVFAMQESLDKDARIEELEAVINELESRIHEAYEVYVGSEGFKPETAPEAYLQELVYKMASTLKEGCA